MSIAQAAPLRTFIQNLEGSGADLPAYPDAAELVNTWGATQYDIGALVAAVREGCPPGYIVPMVSKFTNMRLIMVKSTGRFTAIGLLSICFDLRYIRSRSQRVARNLRNYAVGYPVGSAVRDMAEDVAEALDNPTARGQRTWGIAQILTNAISNIPLLAGRISAAERRMLQDEAAKLAA